MRIVRIAHIRTVLLPLVTALASCGIPSSAGSSGQARENAVPMEPVEASTAFAMTKKATLDQPWAMAFEPGTGNLFVTEKKGAVRFLRPDGTIGSVSGVPKVAYGGQGGLGDIAFAPDYPGSGLVYLSWAEAGANGTRGAAVGRARLDCSAGATCALRGLQVIWRQPKVTGRGHYSHRLIFSPDGKSLFVTSGDRQKLDPAQDRQSSLGKIIRLDLSGLPAPGDPAGDSPIPAEIWTLGHRNMLGIAFDAEGRLWEIEHGPQGGDELNLVQAGKNYGWPIVSNGDHYGGRPIPNHDSRPEFAPPALSWNPVIAPGGMIIYSGSLFPELNGHALIAGLKSRALIDVALDGISAREVARYRFGARLRAIAQAPDGAIWVAEDGDRAALWRLGPVAS